MNISRIDIEEVASSSLKKEINGGEEIRVVLDGNNIVYSSLEKGKPKISNLVEVLEKLKQFSTVDVIASFISAKLRHTIDDPSKLEELIQEGIVTQTPAEVPDDFFILQTAEEFEAFVISNDLYRKQRKIYPWINERRIPFIVIRGKIIFAGLLSPRYEEYVD